MTVAPATLNLARSLAALAGCVVASGWLAPRLIAAQGWTLAGETAVTAMLVFLFYAAAYLAIALAYIVRRKAHDRHIFPEGLRVHGPLAVKLGIRYLILASIALFGATLIYAVILRGAAQIDYLR
ncbi:MAG: hypothetical protein HZA24_00640 [Nitrospirae bacterium]|nr:hypothetical protein [Nitrospirota bacterium]